MSIRNLASTLWNVCFDVAAVRSAHERSAKRGGHRSHEDFVHIVSRVKKDNERNTALAVVWYVERQSILITISKADGHLTKSAAVKQILDVQRDAKLPKSTRCPS